jgi:hypothetical protein
VYLEKNGHELLVLVWVPWIPRDVLGAVRHGTTRQIVCLLLQQVQFDVGSTCFRACAVFSFIDAM